MENSAFGLARRGFLAKGFVPIRVERLTQGIDRSDAVFGEESFKLALD
jgi:hypothetical protein